MTTNPVYVAERKEHRDAVNALTETDRTATLVDVQAINGVGGDIDDARYERWAARHAY